MTTDPSGNDPTAPPAVAGDKPAADAIVPGDWVHVDYRGRDVLGMIDRLQDGLYTFAFWDAGVLRLGSANPAAIGQRDERLTAQFRAAIAVDPHYVSKYLAQWTGPAPSAPPPACPPPRRQASRWVQLRLFPE